MYYFSLLLLLNKEFKFESSASDGYRDGLMISISINSTAILNIHSVDYRCIIIGISKSEATNLLKNVDLSESCGSL